MQLMVVNEKTKKKGGEPKLNAQSTTTNTGGYEGNKREVQKVFAKNNNSNKKNTPRNTQPKGKKPKKIGRKKKNNT